MAAFAGISAAVPGCAHAASIQAELVAAGVAAHAMGEVEVKSARRTPAQISDDPAARDDIETQDEKDAKTRGAAAAAAARAKAALPADPEAGEANLELGPAKSLSLGSRLEITAGSNGLFSFSDVSTQISLFAEVRYRLSTLVQLGGSFAYRYQSGGGTSDTAFQGLVGPTLNFALGEEPSLAHAFFITPKIGLTTGRTLFGNVVVNSNTQATFALNLGKRFAFSESVAYAPSIGVVKEMNFSPNFTIQPLSLSVFF